ncbi:MAG TPA: 4-hydroxy-3-methylbut-2-enyl diphosphate reductase [Candidatus Didemnitutus sp.]|nr:4-hydroxy-3-methylbut-2-enyl diphosphate reductase [Candidatus Didemnitutus sp.]
MTGTVTIDSDAALLAFNASNQLAVARHDGSWNLAFSGPDAEVQLHRAAPDHTPPAEYFSCEIDGHSVRVWFTQVANPNSSIEFRSLDELAHEPVAPRLATLLRELEPYLIEIPYLHLGENDYIYKFRVEKARNRDIYQQDEAARSLYQSRLCDAIKLLSRTNERAATAPATLDFGAVRYVIPSHFGFCLGVKNAIERAYETLAENPGRRVFMLSELIHNSFVNEDLLRRGLRFLQSDKGVPYATDGREWKAGGPAPALWDTLTPDDVVIIPAFGATDEDKKRLVRKGIRVAQYDATCMLVEKVWKAARAYGREGFTVVIHGKSEHEETKATFSNSRRYAPSVIIRNMDEARLLGDYILHPDEARAAAIRERFAGVSTPDFDPARHLVRLAVVNQTTLLMNETAAIIDYFKSVFTGKYGEIDGPAHVAGAGRKDTLCYATQVNQDALSRALAEPLDAAFIIGGKNSSNTYQLHRVCEQKLGNRAFFIQSEANIRSRCEIEHYVFPAQGRGRGGHVEVHSLWPANDHAPKRVLITGGASCPDGLVQQVITRINSFFPAGQLRRVDDVLADLSAR